MTSQAYEEIKRIGTLPGPAGVAQDILRVANDESATIHEIADVVQKDPVTASRLLMLVNSPLVGVPQRVAAIPMAIALLGVDAVKSAVVGFSLISQFRRGPCKEFDYDAFWSGSVATAAAARHVAHVCKHVAPEEFLTCGLLCQIGRLALATVYPEEYADALTQADLEEAPQSIEVERELFGIDSNQLASEMMADWGLPAVFCDAVCLRDMIPEVKLRGSERLESIARTLHFAVEVSNVLLQPTPRQESVSLLVSEAATMSIQQAVLGQVLDSIGREWRAIGPIFNVTTHEVPPSEKMFAGETVD